MWGKAVKSTFATFIVTKRTLDWIHSHQLCAVTHLDEFKFYDKFDYFPQFRNNKNLWKKYQLGKTYERLIFPWIYLCIPLYFCTLLFIHIIVEIYSTKSNFISNECQNKWEELYECKKNVFRFSFLCLFV